MSIDALINDLSEWAESPAYSNPDTPINQPINASEPAQETRSCLTSTQASQLWQLAQQVDGTPLPKKAVPAIPR